MVVTMGSRSDRYEPLPSLLELPGHLLRKLPPRLRRPVQVVAAALLLAVVAGAVVALPRIRADQRAQDARDARHSAAALSALKARYAREARPRRGRGPAGGGLEGAPALSARRALAAGLEAAVLADARARARRGQLHGHYVAATCSRYPKGLHDRPPADDLGRAVVPVQCLAVSADVASRAHLTNGSLIGQPYRAVVDFARGRYAFCKIVQQPGEMSIQRDAVLAIPRACRGTP
jgi:hypothetical protein